MHVPEHFSIKDQDKIFNFMRNFNFATLVTAGKEIPKASQLPLIIHRNHAGSVILGGHLSRRNDHWRDFENIDEALVIFSGPHSYISPSWYKNSDLPPTWNYSTVHAYGLPNIIHDEDKVRHSLSTLTLESERGIKGKWSVDLMNRDTFKNMIKGIVVFEILLTRIEAKWKMSQNRDFDDAVGAALGLEANEDENSLEVASEIRTLASRPSTGI